jgi:3-dehydroquinate synthase class II
MLAQTPGEMARLAIELLTGDAGRLVAIAGAARQSWASRFTLERYQQEMLGAIAAAAR